MFLYSYRLLNDFVPKVMMYLRITCNYLNTLIVVKDVHLNNSSEQHIIQTAIYS